MERHVLTRPLMHYRELRRLFLHLAAVVAPLPASLIACGGAVSDGDGRQGGSVGGEGGGTGGYRNFMGSTGGYAVYTGVGGYPTYVGTGGYPTYMGTGGYPTYMGTGGYPTYMGGGAGPYRDAGTGGALLPETGGAGGSTGMDLCSGSGAGGFPCDAFCVDPGGDASADSGPFDCAAVCSVSTDAVAVPYTCSFVEVSSKTLVRCQYCVGGRRPPGLEPTTLQAGSDLRRYFEEMARLEAASVPAFRRLARELMALGAPKSLVRAARRAARDEIRHTRMGRDLAERFGGRYTPPRIEAQPLRNVEELSIDNAVEGCVRETFGALIATHQARAAVDPVVRRIMKRVAIDETRHAALAQRVARWTERRLDAQARARVADARMRAAETVLRELEVEPSPTLATVGGLPNGAAARTMARAMLDHVWS